MVTLQQDKKEAQDKYDDLYYETVSDDDSVDGSLDPLDFQKPSQ